ncbi:AlpA family transcriptional regulator [Mycobacterium sp. E2733]|uniref:helix-turn-helix transcriptional regulator n=1 Tax=Mycobacterium sp. E2733 TaxID=1834138 RepID=UPI00082B3F12|nr:helix-turn-helix domain-containing protein [Mycobacterium sp. E2733]
MPTLQPAPRRQYVTVQQVSQQHQISERTVYRFVQRGILRPFRVGPKLIRFDADEVEQAFARR